MKWTVVLTELAEKDLRKLSTDVSIRVVEFLHERVASQEDPRILAKMLVGRRPPVWRFRVGDYRVMACIDNANRIVTVIEIGHRREIYRKGR